jgi:hypothetical protein
MELNNIITEEIKRYQELMGQPSEMLNEFVSPIRYVRGLGRFATGAAKNSMDTIVTKEIKTGINKAFKNTTNAFFSDIISGVKKIDDFGAKVNPQEVSNNIVKSLRKQGYVLTNLEEMALRKEVSTSIKKTIASPSQKLRMYKKSFNSVEMANFNKLKAGKNLSDDQLLKLARKAKGSKVTPNPIPNTGPNPSPVPKPTQGTSKFKAFTTKVKDAWNKVRTSWGTMSKFKRRFLVLTGAALLAWLYFVLSKENYCKCLLNMMVESDADYMEQVGMEDGMFLGITGNETIDAQGGCIFYENGRFKTKNGKFQGTYTCSDSGVVMNSGGQEYKLDCRNGVINHLPEEGDTNNGNGNGNSGTTIVFKDCLGPEYQIGCTDKGDLIERVQACLRVPVTGKFDKDLEAALLKKIGKKTFTEEDVFIICGNKSMTQFTFG